MRNRIFWSIALSLLTVGLGAQVTNQGNFVIGGAVGFSAARSDVTQEIETGDTREDSPSTTQFNIAPQVGYFLLDKLAVGIRMDYTFNRVREMEETQVRDSDLLFGPFSRYYVPMGEDMAFIIEAGFGFGNSNDEQLIGTTTQRINTNIFAFGIGPGLTIISNDAIGIEALVKYNFARSDFDTQLGGVNRSTVSRTNQLDLSIGIQFYFGGIKQSSAGGFY